MEGTLVKRDEPLLLNTAPDNSVEIAKSNLAKAAAIGGGIHSNDVLNTLLPPIALEDDDGNIWTFDVLGPLKGYGGNDWHMIGCPSHGSKAQSPTSVLPRLSNAGFHRAFVLLILCRFPDAGSNGGTPSS